jgi:hypothetical protein
VNGTRLENAMELADKARRLLDRAKIAMKPVTEGVVRTYDVSRLKLEITGLKRSLDDVSRELGRRSVEALRERGTLSADAVSAILRRFDEIEDRIAQKERQIAELEREDRPAPGANGQA